MGTEGGPPSSDPSEMTVQALTAGIHEHLEATEQLPLDAGTNRWLGEAQAVAADIATSDVPATVAIDRAETVVDLLERAGDIDDPVAREHVATSLTLARELVERG
jgi:hypothetical protein